MRKNFKQIMVLFFAAMFASSNLFADKVLFLTNKDDASNLADKTVVETLEEEAYDIVIKNSKAFDVTDLEDVDVIFLAEAIGSGDPASLYAAELAGKIGIALINNEPYGYNASDRFHWAAGNRKGMTDFGRIFITEEGAQHPIFSSLGYSEKSVGEEGSIQILVPTDEGGKAKMAYLGVEDFTIGQVIATDGTEENTKGLICAIEKGTDLGGGVVTQGRRVFFPIANANQELTDEGKRILLSTVKWAIEGNDIEISDRIEMVKTKGITFSANHLFAGTDQASIEVFDITGKVCISADGVSSLDCKTLGNGLYIAHITTQEGEQSIKINVKK